MNNVSETGWSGKDGKGFFYHLALFLYLTQTLIAAPAFLYGAS